MPPISAQELRVDRHDDRAGRHEDSGDGWCHQKAGAKRDAGSHRDRDRIVARCPNEVLHHLLVSGARKAQDRRDIARIKTLQGERARTVACLRERAAGAKRRKKGNTT